MSLEVVFMKRCKRSSLLVFCAVAVFLAGSSTLLAQVADLPIKAGLWETRVNTKVGSAETNHDVPVVVQVCFTTGLTLADYMSALNRGSARGAHCSVSNKVQTAHGISYDSVCTGPVIDSKGHADFQLPDADHFSGTSHTTVTGSAQGTPVNMTFDKTFTAKFLSSNCGDIEPSAIPSSTGK
jgi:hypothetical protein